MTMAESPSDPPADAPPSVGRGDIVAGLQALGIGPGRTVLVHSSLSSFGHVRGGAEAVIDALLEVLGDTGTLVFPTFTWGKFHDKQGIVFDVRHTPCDVGRVPETFRQRPGVMRGEHICHSVAALGPHARRVLGDGVRPFGTGSSFDQLYQLDGLILLIGVGMTVCTAFHMVEEFMQVPYRRYRDFNGSIVVMPDGTRTPSRAVEFVPRAEFRNDFEKMDGILADKGLLSRHRVGSSRLTLVPVRSLFDTTRAFLERDIEFLINDEDRGPH